MEPDKVRLFTFDPKEINWGFKVKQSKRRMKLHIKMSKDETSQWDSLKSAAKPPEMTDDDFARVIFYKGIETFMEALTERINSLSEDEKQEILEKSDTAPETPEPVTVDVESKDN